MSAAGLGRSIRCGTPLLYERTGSGIDARDDESVGGDGRRDLHYVLRNLHCRWGGREGCGGLWVWVFPVGEMGRPTGLAASAASLRAHW